MTRRHKPTADQLAARREAIDDLHLALDVAGLGESFPRRLHRGTVWERMQVNFQRVARSRAGFTRAELAARAGVSEDTVKRWETDIMSLSYEEKRKIADALK